MAGIGQRHLCQAWLSCFFCCGARFGRFVRFFPGRSPRCHEFHFQVGADRIGFNGAGIGFGLRRIAVILFAALKIESAVGPLGANDQRVALSYPGQQLFCLLACYDAAVLGEHQGAGG